MAVTESKVPYGDAGLETRVRRLEVQQDKHAEAIVSLIKYMDNHFDAVDRRLATMDGRIDGIEKCLDAMEKRFDNRFSNIEMLLVDIAQAVKKGPSPQSNA